MALQKSGVILVAESAGAFYADMQKADKAVASFGGSVGDAAPKFSAFGQIATGALRAVGEAAVSMAAEGAKAIGSFVAGSISAAGDFEAGMNLFGASVGEGLAESGKSLDDFKQLFIDLGKELPVSTAEVQEAATTLAKGGLSPAVLAAGALKDSLQFASAAGMGLNEAAELSIKTLGTFGPTAGTAAEQTAFMAQANDLLVKAAGASTLNVDTLGDAMLQAGGAAKATGVDYQDFVTTMGLISPSFGSAAEAATSYKNMLVRLQPSTKGAISAMTELGLYTKESGSAFFDATGKFIGNQKAAELLQNAFAGLSDAQRVSAMQTIFGNDAMGAANALVAAGGEGYAAFAAKMAQANGVQAQAASVQQGYNNALTNAKGSFEALQLTIGNALLPVLTTLLNDYISPGINLVTSFADAILNNGNAFASLSPIVQSVVNVFSGLIDYLGTGKLDNLFSGLTDIFGGPLAMQIVNFADVIRQTAIGFGEGGLSGAINGFLTSITTALPGITTFADTLRQGFTAITSGDLIGGISTVVGGVVDAIIAAAPQIIDAAANWALGFAQWAIEAGVKAAAAVGTIGAQVIGKIGEAAPGIIERVGQWAIAFGQFAVDAAPRVIAAVGEMVGKLLDAVGQAAPGIIEATAKWALAFGQWALDAAPGMLAKLTGLAESLGGWISARVPVIATQVGEWAVSFLAWVPGAATNLIIKLGELAGQLFGWIAGQIPTIHAKIGEWANAFGKWVVEKAVPALMTGLASAWQSLSGWISETAGKISADGSIGRAIADGIRSGINGAWEGLKGFVAQKANELLSAAKSSLGISSPSKAFSDQVGQPIIDGMIVGMQIKVPALRSAAASVAISALEAAKNEIDSDGSTSKGAYNNVGVPFAQGIVEGIADSLDLIKGISRTLSKQLTEDMKAVAEEAVKAFKQILQDNLEADVGFSGTALGNYRSIEDLGKGSGTGDALDAMRKAEADLKQFQQEPQGDAKALAALDAVRAEYEEKRFKTGMRSQEIEDKRLADIAKVNASNATAEEKASQIAVINTQAEKDQRQVKSDLLNLQTEYNQKIAAATQEYNRQVAAVEAQRAALEQAIANARAQLALEQQLDEQRRQNQERARQELEKARQEADAMRAFDPKAADDYYKLRSKQILDLARLEQQRIEAAQNYDSDRQQALETERAMLLANQAAERALFAVNAKQDSPYAGLAEQLLNLQNKVRAELERDQGFYEHTDRNNLEMRNRLANEIAGDQAVLDQITQQLQTLGQAMIGGVAEGISGDAASAMQALQDALALMQRAAEQQLGIHSPSKVLAKSIGMPAMEGIAVGVLRGASLIEKAFATSLDKAMVAPSSMVMPALATVQPAASASQIANSYTSNSYNNGGNTVNISSNLGATQVRAIVRQELAAAGRGAYTRQRTR